MYAVNDKVVVVTGASKGVGAALTTQVLQDGAKHVTMLDVDQVGGAQLEKKLNETYGANKAKFVKCDVTKDEFMRALEDARQEHGHLDLLVNNAGVTLEADYNEIRKSVEINVIGLINGTYKAIELMDKRKGGRGGAVVNISSTAALYPCILPMFAYCATKSAVLLFSEHLGKEPLYSDNGVRIVAVCFGATHTPILNNMHSFAGEYDQYMSDLLKTVPKQSAEEAAKGTLEAYKNGKSASVWVVKPGAPAYDITPERTQCHDIMIKVVENAEEAAKGTLEAYKNGKSASVWVVKPGAPAYDITPERTQCHDIMIKVVEK